MARRRYWSLKLSSWEGLAFNAQHWYGVLWLPEQDDPDALHADRQVHLEYEVRAEHVPMFDKLDPGFAPKVGHLSERFWTRDEALAVGLKTFEENAREGDLLLLNHNGNPVEPLAIKGPDPDHLLGKLRAVWRGYEQVRADGGSWDGKLQRWLVKWDRLLGNR